MPQPVQIIGSPLSPYVRKVLVSLELKGIEWAVDPIVPFFGGDRFAELSPLRRVPVLIDDRATLCDSSVICQYLEDRYPTPALYPADVVVRARARWLEEFADSRMGDVFIWRLFNEVAINPYVWGRPKDTALIERTLQEDVPPVLDYLESQVPTQGWCFGETTPTIADISLAVFFRNAAFARFRIDAQRWPRTAAFIERVLALAPFQKLAAIENQLIRTPLTEHRAVLEKLGVPLIAETYGVATPRKSLMLT